MTTPMQLRTRILRVLEAYSPNSAPLPAISDAINADLPRKVEVPELRDHLSWLLEREMVARIGEALDENATRWVITRVGLGSLQQ